MENVGVELSNRLCSLAPMAHLYNALGQTQLLTESWPAMDQAIEANLSLLFHGSVPVTAHQISSRYILCMNFPITVGARNHRRRKPNWKAIMKRLDFLHVDAESSKYLQAYLGGSASAPKTNHGLTCLEMLHRLPDILPEIVKKLVVDQVTLSRQCSKLL
jgi:hypothetical protein